MMIKKDYTDLRNVDTVTNGNKIFRVPLQDKLTQLFLFFSIIFFCSFHSFILQNFTFAFFLI